MSGIFPVQWDRSVGVGSVIRRAQERMVASHGFITGHTCGLETGEDETALIHVITVLVIYWSRSSM